MDAAGLVLAWIRRGVSFEHYGAGWCSAAPTPDLAFWIFELKLNDG
jgi:hypothetical protein